MFPTAESYIDLLIMHMWRGNSSQMLASTILNKCWIFSETYFVCFECMCMEEDCEKSFKNIY